MSTTAVGHCSYCAAIVNRRWPSCLVCHAPLIAVTPCETGSPTSTAPTHPQADAVTAVPSPMPPLQPGWLVCYRDRRGVLCGGCDDRQHGTVDECRWDGKEWTIHLTDGQRLPLFIIRSVGQTDCAGRIVAAWTVREHGYDGRRQG